MTNYNRGSVVVSTKVAVSADEFWSLLRDWAAVPEWVLPEESPPPPVSVALKTDHDVDTLPCTRVLEFDPPLDFPYEETLLYASSEARRMYYTFSGIPGGLCNYMATTFVDDDGDDCATVSFSSTWDLPVTESLDGMVTYLAAVYEHMITRGIEAAVRSRRNAAPSVR
jgi:hypothetical protein